MADEVKLPTKDDIRRLPRWARVAFAARCARRVLPLFRREWLGVTEEHIQAVSTAIATAEQAAAQATVGGGVPNSASDAAFAAVRAARDALIHSDALTAFSADAADAAMLTALAAGDIADATPPLAATAVSSAAAATSNLALPNIVRDFELLLRRAQAEGWTNDTPVPPEVFGPLDEPAPEPSVAKFVTSVAVGNSATIAQDPQVKFVLRAVAEPDVSAETVAKHVVAVFKALNEYTLAKYGVRVTEDEFRRLVYEHAGVGVS